MKLHVPYFSYSIAQQHTLPLTTDGVTCAKMVLDYFGFNPNEDIHSLIEQGNTIGTTKRNGTITTFVSKNESYYFSRRIAVLFHRDLKSEASIKASSPFSLRGSW